ncbi:MAG TPA: ABC transporter permease, partial [Planctomycetota bacterium]|nr:ABC transporter permease [Planctomycetota bacterium]
PQDSSWKQWRAQLPPDSDDFALMPPWPYGPGETDPPAIYGKPSAAHPFGSDDTGRDVLARMLHGTRTAVCIGLGAVLLAMLVGVPIGALAGCCGGWVDLLLLRLIEIFLCFPSLFLALVVAAFFGDSVLWVVLVLASVFWVSFARMVRGELLSLRERDFVATARGLGIRPLQLLRRHLLPQVRGPVLVTAAFCMAQAVTLESTLSFLGLGPGSKASSWGSVLQQGRASAHLGMWHLWLVPALAIVATVLCCHGLADDLRRRRAN